MSAISIRHTDWKECFDAIREHRAQLKRTYGIFMRKEVHATDLVRGKGRISEKIITKWQRSRIFFGLLELVANLPSVQLFNGCWDQKGAADPQMRAWDRITNRIERTMRHFEETEGRLRKGLLANLKSPADRKSIDQLSKRLLLFRPRAIIIADEGREQEITSALRRMHIHNPVPSQFGEWRPGVLTRNITTDRIIEDPVFKASSRSYFLQLADCVSFALLKREVPPTPAVAKYGLHKMFDQTLASICFKPASKDDPLGVVRK